MQEKPPLLTPRGHGGIEKTGGTAPADPPENTRNTFREDVLCRCCLTSFPWVFIYLLSPPQDVLPRIQSDFFPIIVLKKYSVWLFFVFIL